MSETLRYDAAPEQPWRNGRGVTRELHSGDGWRLSIATISGAGEFSSFPGLDRTFVVADGEVDLTVDGTAARLDRGALAAFPGEAPVHATPVHGEAHAVNVMTTRGRVVATVHVERLHGPTPAADALVLLHGSARVDDAPWGRLDTLLAAPVGAAHCDGALVVVVRISVTSTSVTSTSDTSTSDTSTSDTVADGPEGTA